MNVKAVVFDWGGVLIEQPSKKFTRECARMLGVSYRALTWAFSSLYDEFGKGKITESQFWKRVCVVLEEKSCVKTIWYKVFKKVIKKKPKMVELAKQLKEKGYRIAVLSDTEKPSLKLFKEQKFPNFDEKVFSCEVGMKKPSKEIYQHMIEKLGLKPSEIVFIDDLDRNVEGARKAGMKAIKFDNTRNCIRELSRYVKL